MAMDMLNIVSRQQHVTYFLSCQPIGLPDGKVGRNFSIQMQIKTNKREGVLFSVYSSLGTDALSLEMKHGKVSCATRHVGMQTIY